ncbi:expressed unknown protein [Seminavis robusta]|uniref:Uncharacterized protein n=1 Tax=Seminavis robusta TaxID=568900 RepID=A0A9N8DJ51_9STRA|nr:expressed unknown protein [Seminavis robusta]|eukprot:Sro88_g046640.1 n/a (107) ;mRNA; r:86556-87014
MNYKSEYEEEKKEVTGDISAVDDDEENDSGKTTDSDEEFDKDEELEELSPEILTSLGGKDRHYRSEEELRTWRNILANGETAAEPTRFSWTRALLPMTIQSLVIRI